MQIHFSKILFGESICSKHIFGTLAPCVFAFSASATELEHFISTANQAIDAIANTMIIGPNKDENFRDILAQNILAVKGAFSNVLTSVKPPMALMTTILDTYLEGQFYPCFEFLLFLIREDLTVTKLRAQPNSLVLFQQTTMPATPTLENLEHLYLVCRYPSIDLSKCTNLKSLGFFDGGAISGTNRSHISTLARNTKVLQNLFIMNWGASEIGYNAFNDAKSLVNVIINKSTTFGNYAFFVCESLKTASFADIQTIGSYAFALCQSLTALSLPLAKTINGSAFDGCISLKTISCPILETIFWWVFSGCNSLVEAYFPAVTSIGEGAFSNCTSLQKITYAKDAEVHDNAFPGCLSTLQKLNP
ncbi:MAG: leucine-rich repeat domain-containing protein [Holosporales bacterium]|jgi:hypothetical protein|nr:leucine-rich repeat domain-containing protein [Holosporales bacterium]